MDYKLVFTKKAESDLNALSPLVVTKVLKKIRFFLANAIPMQYAKKLKGLPDYYRFRIGEYRVIFRQDIKSQRLVVLVILRIGHRKAIYKGQLL